MVYLTKTLTALLLLVSTLVTAFDNHLANTFAQGLTSPLEEAKKLLSDIQSLRNNSGATDLDNFSGSSDLPTNSSDSGLGDNNSSDFGLGDNNSSDFSFFPGRKDLSGHYNNLKFGIVDFVIPPGWFASENIEGEKMLSVDVQQGTAKKG